MIKFVHTANGGSQEYQLKENLSCGWRVHYRENENGETGRILIEDTVGAVAKYRNWFVARWGFEPVFTDEMVAFERWAKNVMRPDAWRAMVAGELVNDELFVEIWNGIFKSWVQDFRNDDRRIEASKLIFIQQA